MVSIADYEPRSPGLRPGGSPFIVALSMSHLPPAQYWLNQGCCGHTTGLEDCDVPGDYIVPNVLSPRYLVSRPDKMDETVLHIIIFFLNFPD